MRHEIPKKDNTNKEIVINDKLVIINCTSSLDLFIVIAFLKTEIFRNKFVYASYIFVSALKFDGKSFLDFPLPIKLSYFFLF